MRRFFFAFVGALLSGGSLFCLLWSVLPPPRYGLWITGLIAGEWALWLGGAGLLGAGLGVGAFRMGHRASGIVIIGAGFAAVVLSLLPYFQTLPVARASGVRLSFVRYFSRLPGRETGTPNTTETYAAPNGQPLLLDIYLPPSDRVAQSKRAAVIVIHGGSWRAGNRSDFPRWNAWLAQNGFVVFDIDYRLAPQPNFKTAPGDVKAAVLWVKKNADKWGVDKNRVALLGRSAGGQLALLAAYAPNDAAVPPSSGRGDDSVAAVVSLYGPADLVWGFNHPAHFDIIQGQNKLLTYLGGSPKTAPQNYALVSPVERVTRQSPPTLLFHGLRDTIVGPVHTERLTAQLSTKGVMHQTVYFPYATHGFDYNFNGWGAQVVQKRLLQFLQTHLQAAR